jgi:hypothetical protein
MNSDERKSKINNLNFDTESVQEGGVLGMLGLSPLPSTGTPSLVTPFQVPGLPSIKLDSNKPTALLGSNGINVVTPQLGMSGYGGYPLNNQTIPPAGMTIKPSLNSMIGLTPTLTGSATMSPVVAMGSNFPMMMSVEPDNDNNDTNVIGVTTPGNNPTFGNLVTGELGTFTLGSNVGMDMGGFLNKKTSTKINLGNGMVIDGKKLGEEANKIFNGILMGNPVPNPYSGVQANSKPRLISLNGSNNYVYNQNTKSVVNKTRGQVNNFGAAGIVLVERSHKGNPAVILFREKNSGLYSDLGGSIDAEDHNLAKQLNKNTLWIAASRESREESAGLIHVDINNKTPYVDISKNYGGRKFRSYIIGIPSGFVNIRDFDNNLSALRKRNANHVMREMNDMTHVYTKDIVSSLKHGQLTVNDVNGREIKLSKRALHILREAMTKRSIGKTAMQTAIDNVSSISIGVNSGGKLSGLKKLIIK